MASQANEDLFSVESTLGKILNCIDLFQSALVRTSSRARSRSKKRPRVSDDTQKFQATLEEIGEDWSRALKQLFELKMNDDLYGRIAFNLIKTLQLTREFYKVRDSYYKLTIDCIIKPIIISVLDEKILDYRNKVINDRIVTLIKMILIESLKHHEGGLCNLPAASFESESESWRINRGSGSEASNHDEDETSSSHRLHSIEESMIMQSMLDIFKTHVDRITDRDFDFSAHIGSIMNITRLTKIFHEQIMNLKCELIARTNQDMIQIESSEKQLLAKSLEVYERELRNLHRSLDICNPWTLFRKELREISIHVSLLKGMVQ